MIWHRNGGARRKKSCRQFQRFAGLKKCGQIRFLVLGLLFLADHGDSLEKEGQVGSGEVS